MQKKLVALAVVAAFSAPVYADVTVYGQAHTSLDSYGGYAPANGSVAGVNGTTNPAGTKNGLNLTSNSSRVGFKGTEELSNGLKSVFQLETEVFSQGTTTMFAAQRDSYVGLAGGFGTVVAGRLPLANQYANDANFFGAKVGDAGNFTAGGFGGFSTNNTALGQVIAVPSRVSRAIGYVSPSFGGVTVTVGYVPNTQQSLTQVQNLAGKSSSYTLRAAYDSNNIFAAGSLVRVGLSGVNAFATPTITATPATTAGAKITITSLAGGYDFGIAKVRAQYVGTSANAQAAAGLGLVGDVKQNVITIGGQFNLGEDNAIKAQYAKATDLKLAGATVANTNASMMAIGFDHKMSKATTVYAAYAKVSNGTNAMFNVSGYAHGGVTADAPTAAGTSYSPSALSLGLIRDF